MQNAPRILHKVRGSRCSARARGAHRITAAYPQCRSSVRALASLQGYAADLVRNWRACSADLKRFCII